MTIKYSKRITILSPSATFAMAQKSNELKAQGVDIVNMSVGEPDFNTPDHIKEIGEEAIRENYTRYSPISGYKGLKEAISGKLSKENALRYPPDEILVTIAH